MEMNAKVRFKMSIPVDEDTEALFDLSDETSFCIWYDEVHHAIVIEEDEYDECGIDRDIEYEDAYSQGYHDGISASSDADKIMGYKAGYKNGYDTGYSDMNKKLRYNPTLLTNDPAFVEFLKRRKEKGEEEPEYRPKSYLD